MPNVTLGNVKAIGAMIDVVVGLSAPQAKVLEQIGLPPIWPILSKAMLDTGASSTLVDFSLVNDLGLLPTGQVEIKTPSTGTEPLIAPTFNVQLQLIGPPHVSVAPVLKVIAADLSPFGIRVLLGRDVQSRCLLIYNGPSDQFTFSF
jgi:hypothetical protein